MTKLQTVSLLKTKKKLHLFSFPHFSLPLASLTPSYSVGSLQGQWIVRGQVEGWQRCTPFGSLYFLLFIKHTLNGSHPHYPGGYSISPTDSWYVSIPSPAGHITWAACKHHSQRQDLFPWAAAKSYSLVSLRQKLPC